jgi:hypothetical protein
MAGFRLQIAQITTLGLYQGTTLSRAVKNQRRIGLQPLPGRILPEILVRREFWGEKNPGAKARILLALCGPTEVVS